MKGVPSVVTRTEGVFEQTWDVNGRKVTISRIKGGTRPSIFNITLDGRRIDTALTVSTARARALAQIAKLQEAA